MTWLCKNVPRGYWVTWHTNVLQDLKAIKVLLVPSFPILLPDHHNFLQLPTKQPTHRLYSGDTWYFKNSICHCSSVSGGRPPANFQSVIDSPDRVRRVIPPSTTMLNTQPVHPNSHIPTFLWLRTPPFTRGTTSFTAPAAIDTVDIRHPLVAPCAWSKKIWNDLMSKDWIPPERGKAALKGKLSDITSTRDSDLFANLKYKMYYLVKLLRLWLRKRPRAWRKKILQDRSHTGNM